MGGNPRLANASDFPTGDRTHDQQLLGGAARQPIFPGESSSPAVCSGQGQSHGVRMGGGALQIRYRGRAVVWEEIPGPVPAPPARPREATGKKQKPPTPQADHPGGSIIARCAPGANQEHRQGR